MRRFEQSETLSAYTSQAAVDQGNISGDRIRLDTTAVETNIHWPCDSSLLGDCYRTLTRLVESMRSLDPDLVDSRRLQCRKVKRFVQKIGRRSRGKTVGTEARTEALKPLYAQLITLVYSKRPPEPLLTGRLSWLAC